MRGAADGLAAGCRQRTTGDSPTRPVEGLAPSAFSTQPDFVACMCDRHVSMRPCSSDVLIHPGHEGTQATHTVTGRGEPHLRTREYRQILLIAAAHTLHSSRKLIHRTSSKNHRPRSEHQTHVQVRKAPLVIDPMLPPRLPVSAIPAAPSHRLRLHSRCVHDDSVSSAKFEWCGGGHGGAHAHPPMAGRQ